MTVDLIGHTLVRAKEDDLIVLLVSSDISDSQMDSLEQFAEAIAEETAAVLAILPANVVKDCVNYTIQDLLDLRGMVDDLIANRVEQIPAVEV